MTTVPLHLVPEVDDPRQVLPHVDLEVAGERVTAILDTGAGTTQLVERPGLEVTPSDGSTTGHGALGLPVSSVGTARVEIGLASVTARPVVAHVVERGTSTRSDLLGLDVLSQFRCRYRLADGVLDLDAEPPATTHPVDVGANGHVHLATSWPGVEASGLFDTGASLTVVGRHVVDEHPHLFIRVGHQSGTDASGSTVDAVLAVVRGPLLLGTRFDDALVAVVDLAPLNRVTDRPVDLILGWSLLSQAEWYVDHLGARAACTRSSTSSEVRRTPTDRPCATSPPERD